MSRHLFLVDAYGFVFRAFHALPPLTRPDGTPVGAVYGFINMLLKLREDIEKKHEDASIIIVFDSGGKTFRDELFSEYKANRDAPPEDLIPQFPLVRDAAQALGIISIEKDGFEADDIIATFVKSAKGRGDLVTIVSSDKDLMQLISPGVKMYDAMKSRDISEKEVKEKFGVGPDRVIDVLALIGDSSDNIPGVPGIGPKTAEKLINQFGSFDNIFANIDQVTQKSLSEKLRFNEDKAKLSRQLVTLCDTVPVDYGVIDKPLSYDPLKLITFLKENGFKSLVAKLEKQHQITPNVDKPSVSHEVLDNLRALDSWLVSESLGGKMALLKNESQLYLASETKSCAIQLAQEPLGQASFNFEPSENKGNIFSHLKTYFSDPSILWILHDAKSLMKDGTSFKAFDDVMIMSYVLDGTIHEHDLKTLTNTEQIDNKTVSGIFSLHMELKQRLIHEKMLSLYENIEKPLIAVLAEIEKTGIKIDVRELEALSNDFGQRIQNLEKEIHKISGVEFLISSPKQLGEILFEHMKLPGGKKNKSGGYSTGADILEELSMQGHVIADKLLEWRQLTKLKSTYTDALANFTDPKTKRIHTTFSMASTSTGRLSSIEPNLQNIPIRTEEGRKIRKAFIAEEEYKLISADYSQIELRLIAHLADIPVLKNAFREGKDIHATTASRIFSVPLDKVDSEMRRRAKTVNFGIIYGQSAFGLATQLKISRTEAASIIKAYFLEYPGIEAYMKNTVAEAREKGFTTTIYGRKCYVPWINDKNPVRRNFAERAAINAPLQGSAADIIKRAMISLSKDLKRGSLKSRMILQVHDELLLEAPENEVENVKVMVKRVMESATSLSVPLIVEVRSGSDWGEVH